ncbi:MAG: peroxiredoxin family protein [Longimicrobiales bacterium]
MTTRTRRTWLLRGSAALLIGTFLVLGWISRGRFSPVDAGSAAPPYRAATLTGDTVMLSDYAGKVVLLNVWATWCKPCVQEMPALQRLYERLGSRGLEVVAVSVDATVPAIGGGAGDIGQFVRELGLTFPILHDASGAVESTFHVMGLPVTIMITRDGRIHKKVLGARDWDNPRHASEIEKLLAD